MTRFSIHPLGVVVTVLLAACGGGGNGQSSSAPATAIDSPAGGAAYAAAVAQYVGVGDSVVQSKQAKAQPERKAARAKAVQTEDCEVSGTVEFNAQTGRTDYRNCRSEISEGFFETINGVEIFLCDSSVGGGSSYTNDCMGKFFDTYGESNTPLTYHFLDDEGYEARFSELYTDRYSEVVVGNDEGYGYDSLLNGRVSVHFDIQSGAKPITSTFSNLRLVEHYYDDGREEYQINGRFGTDLGVVATGCASGTATYATSVPISVSNTGVLVTGAMTITNERNQTASLTISNGSVTITVNGQSASYTQAELSALCDS